jgi:hypothetical protein
MLSRVALRARKIVGDVWFHDSSLSCRVVRAARHVRRAERSGGQQSEGDGRTVLHGGTKNPLVGKDETMACGVGVRYEARDVIAGPNAERVLGHNTGSNPQAEWRPFYAPRGSVAYCPPPANTGLTR